MTALVVRADSRTLPLADNTVDLVVTSPPYFGLRSYQDGGKHYAGQVGDEATPAEFVAALLAVTAECVRVLKPTGSLWVNLGDKYSTYDSRPGKAATHEWAQKSQQAERYTRNAPAANGVAYKSLMGIPWRYALACMSKPGRATLDAVVVNQTLDLVEDGRLSMDEARGILDDQEQSATGLGLILRAEVIWSKPNGLPESVTDRVRRSHEQWFHMTLEPRYFSAVDEVREAHAPGTAARYAAGYSKDSTSSGLGRIGQPDYSKLPGSVWTIPTQPLQVPASLGVDHFAAFPMEWPRRIIKGWSPSGICTACGEGRQPDVQVDRVGNCSERRGSDRGFGVAQGDNRNAGVFTIIGESCACPTPDAPTRPSVVLDPFGGTGTTALVASALGRTGISCDLSHDYSRLARWRTNDPAQRAAAMQVDKPPVEVDGQDDLFGGAA